MIYRPSIEYFLNFRIVSISLIVFSPFQPHPPGTKGWIRAPRKSCAPCGNGLPRFDIKSWRKAVGQTTGTTHLRTHGWCFCACSVFFSACFMPVKAEENMKQAQVHIETYGKHRNNMEKHHRKKPWEHQLL